MATFSRFAYFQLRSFHSAVLSFRAMSVLVFYRAKLNQRMHSSTPLTTKFGNKCKNLQESKARTWCYTFYNFANNFTVCVCVCNFTLLQFYNFQGSLKHRANACSCFFNQDRYIDISKTTNVFLESGGKECQHSTQPGLPDFSWNDIPKTGNYPNRPENTPHGREIYQMAAKYSEWL
jgi:hypothetical protein